MLRVNHLEVNLFMKTNISIKSLLLVLFILINSLILNAQREADVLYDGLNLTGETELPYGPILIKFNEDTLESITFDTPAILTVFYSRAAYADKYGNFKFASNNWRLVNSLGEVLSYKLWREDMTRPTGTLDTTTVDVAKGPLFLNDPGDSTKAYLFYGQYKTIPAQTFSTLRRDIYFTYAYLDVPTQQLISQNNIILTDTTTTSDMMAVRHANGRDWWLIKPGLFTNVYYIGLVSPTGISPMQRVEIPNLIPHEQVWTCSFFSQNGSKFVHCTDAVNHWVQTLDFDRCTGQFTNPIEYDFNSLLRNGNVSGWQISPDATKAYFYRLTYEDSTVYIPGTFQYDFNNMELTKLTNQQNLAFLSPNFKEIFFGTRVDIGDSVFRYYSTINHPNVSGLGCDVDLNKYFIPNRVPLSISSHNFANFRLGPIDGSSCDSLGIDNPVLVEEAWEAQENKFAQVFPNPFATELNLRLQTEPQKPLLLQVHSAFGQLIWQRYISQQTTQLPIGQLSKGLYLLRILDENGKVRHVEKVVKND